MESCLENRGKGDLGRSQEHSVNLVGRETLLHNRNATKCELHPQIMRLNDIHCVALSQALKIVFCNAFYWFLNNIHVKRAIRMTGRAVKKVSTMKVSLGAVCWTTFFEASTNILQVPQGSRKNCRLIGWTRNAKYAAVVARMCGNVHKHHRRCHRLRLTWRRYGDDWHLYNVCLSVSFWPVPRRLRFVTVLNKAP